MRIGVSMRVSPTKEYAELRDAISHDWVRYLDSLGLFPLLIPNALGDAKKYARDAGIDALLLTGGNDVSPQTYGAELESSSGDSACLERDQTELQLLAFAEERRLPVLGVCRGMQLLNVYFGGSLVQSIARQIGPQVNHVAHDHPVKIIHPKFAEFLGETRATVNSYHTQGVVRDVLGKDLEPFAESEADGVLEGIVHARLPMAGVQWHPERKNPARAIDQKLVRAAFSGELKRIL